MPALHGVDVLRAHGGAPRLRVPQLPVGLPEGWALGLAVAEGASPNVDEGGVP